MIVGDKSRHQKIYLAENTCMEWKTYLCVEVCPDEVGSEDATTKGKTSANNGFYDVRDCNENSGKFSS